MLKLKYLNASRTNTRKKNNALKACEVRLKERKKMPNDRITGFRQQNVRAEIPDLLCNVNMFLRKICHT